MLTSLRYVCHTVGTLEVPDEVSLIYTVSGCPLRCPGCHSSDLRNPSLGQPLDRSSFGAALDRYAGLASCVCFLGGEWQPDALIELLKLARDRGLATCLYSGLEEIDDRIAVHLDYLKLGPFIAARGGLDQPGTNQRFLDLRSGRDLTHRFQRHAAPAFELAA
ncbi:4Fe-4S cluster-binding domain-containing protein [Haloferula sp. A504]|uniref:4Fe-4S cluster-binding domain-containing protein n=1 Tax=Haloferula sp. A504 TaxID=3373601 RepID=UPI0031C0F4BC|nr:4Fe-4S cluster-binding domain-containing protein [Verrucomicrobiaceae bacterium E54]